MEKSYYQDENKFFPIISDFKFKEVKGEVNLIVTIYPKCDHRNTVDTREQIEKSDIVLMHGGVIGYG